MKNKLIETQNELERNINIKLNEVEIKIEEHEENENNEVIYTDTILCETSDVSQSNLAECPECSHLFDESVIANHIKKHMKGNPYNCDKCEYTTDRKSRLVTHCKKAHNSSAPPRKNRNKLQEKIRKQCSLCGSLVKNLVEHMKMTHQNVTKKFICDFCDYKCHFRAKMERHLQRHLPKEYRISFECSQCDFRKIILISHHLNSL